MSHHFMAFLAHRGDTGMSRLIDRLKWRLWNLIPIMFWGTYIVLVTTVAIFCIWGVPDVADFVRAKLLWISKLIN